jgi:DNA helicase-2/ATP-dependent DNA helicase PcrA
MFNPRPKQAEVLQFRHGKMGIAAVPGSGKTHTLSYLAATLIIEDKIDIDQEVLIVTLVNSAVSNFSSRIEGFIQEVGLLPGIGYRVRTLHGLAHDIVRERPDLIGLDSQFQIIDERDSFDIISSSVNSWVKMNPDFIQENSSENAHFPSQQKREREWLNLLTQNAISFIKQAKDLQIEAYEIEKLLHQVNIDLPLLEMGCQVYQDYQTALNLRGAVDFDDLIRLALQALQRDPEFCLRLQNRWPYILEDEAQDSSRLQEQILRLLCGNAGNWVRVGDPNQAIYETFTTANPKYLQDFLKEDDVIAKELPNSGRSTRSIIELANHLISWTQNNHPAESLRMALSPPLIEPTPPGDPQPNPPDEPSQIFLFDKKLKADQEITTVVKSIKKWLPHNQDKTIAVLVARNSRGVKLVEALQAANIEYVELLKSSQSTRETIKTIVEILKYIDRPTYQGRLAEIYLRLNLDENSEPSEKERHEKIARLIQNCRQIEQFLWPVSDGNWLETLVSDNVEEGIIQSLLAFRKLVTRWQEAAILPVDQLVLTIGQDLFTQPADLALTHKLALALEQMIRSHPNWHLPELIDELNMIVNNQRKFLGFGAEDTGFEPDDYQGKVVVSTIHKAKGLEWDRVYLLSINNYDFPSLEPYDSYFSEKWFVRDHLNLEAETIETLKKLVMTDPETFAYQPGEATDRARIEYASERLRLLFVGITRAREALILTYNTGRDGKNNPALPFIALQTFWEANRHEA